MRKFLLVLLCFSLPVFLVIVITFNANGYTDPFYLRFTSPEQSSLIIGTSRAAQGIVPEVLNTKLGRTDFYNYSFTVAHSPFGEAYFNSIKKKLATTTKNGLFIVAVDPWSISCSEDENLSRFRESNLAVSNTSFVNQNPNLEYLVKNYDKPMINLFGEQPSQGWYLHNDGWLEVDVAMNRTAVVQRIKEKEKEYREMFLPVFKPSEIRVNWLIQTIRFLKKHGKVFIVRLPVHENLFEIDNLLMPEFNRKMLELGNNMEVPFLDLTDCNDAYEYTDGNHLYRQSARVVSERIAEWVKQKIAESWQQ